MNIFENIFMYILIAIGFALICIAVFLIIKDIIEIHNKYESSVMESIREVGIFNLLMCVVGFFALIFMFYAITFTEKEFQRTTICNVEVNSDNTLYKYKVTKYDEIEYRDKQLNGEWKEGNQTIKKTEPEIIYTDDISEYNSSIKQKEK